MRKQVLFNIIYILVISLLLITSIVLSARNIKYDVSTVNNSKSIIVEFKDKGFTDEETFMISLKDNLKNAQFKLNETIARDIIVLIALVALSIPIFVITFKKTASIIKDPTIIEKDKKLRADRKEKLQEAKRVKLQSKLDKLK